MSDQFGTLCIKALKAYSLTELHAFSYKQRFFSTQPQCCLTLSWIELQMLLNFCLIHRSIIILRYIHISIIILNTSSYWDTFIDLGLFLSYLCDLFFIFIFIFIMINRIILWTQTQLFFCLLSRIFPIVLDDNVMKNVNNFEIVKVQPGIVYKSVYLFSHLDYTFRICPASIYAFTCSKLQWKHQVYMWYLSVNKDAKTTSMSIFHLLFWCFYCWLWTSKS